MNHRLAISILLSLSILFAAVIFFEVEGNPAEKTAIAAAHPRPAAPATRPQRKGRRESFVRAILARPLFSPSRRPDVSAGAGTKEGSALADARLTGIVTRQGLRLAIFAVKGKRPLALTEGDSVSGWRIEKITPGAVALRGAGGMRMLAPKSDRVLARPPLPAAFPAPARVGKEAFSAPGKRPPPPYVLPKPPPARPQPWRAR